MADIVQNSYIGGIADDLKIAQSNAYGFSRNLTPFNDANSITFNPKTIKVSGSTVVDLVLWMQDGSPYDTNRYFYDLGGNIYRETSGDVWSNLRTVNESQGQGLQVFDDYLYYAGLQTLGRYGRLTGTPAFSDNFLDDGVTNLDQSQALTGNTYTPPIAISESATNRQSFTPEYDPIGGIEIFVTTKGSGNWTITIHDSEDNDLGSSTIPNASLSDATLTLFSFDEVRVNIGVEYHFHVTSTVADGTMRTGTASDLETSTYNEYFNILIQSTYHPMAQLLNGIVIGNNNYLAFWDNAIYNPNQIQIEHGYQVRALAKENEFIVAYAWKGDDVTSVEDAKAYYWDGLEPTFNYAVPLGPILPNSAISVENKMFGIHGEQGTLYVNTSPLQQVHRAPRLEAQKTLEVAPGGMSQYAQRVVFGYSFNTDDSDGLQQGVYEYGNKSDLFPDAFNFAYTISTGNTSDIKIGSVQSMGEDLYIGWRDDADYGVDKVSITNDPFTSGEWVSLIFDNGNPQKPKYADVLVVEFEPLVSGDTVTPKYAIDQDAFDFSFTTGGAVSTVGSTKAVLPIGKRFNNISFGFNLATTDNYITITSVYLLIKELKEERSW